MKKCYIYVGVLTVIILLINIGWNVFYMRKVVDEDLKQMKRFDQIAQINEGVGLSSEVVRSMEFVAHAGGDYEGLAMTNSLEALSATYSEGYGVVEIDFGYTEDGAVVCIHDWGNANWFMGVHKSTQAMTLKEFQDHEGILGMTFMTLAELDEWSRGHQDMRIITDNKKDNIKVLKLIASKYPNLFEVLIPQIYSYDNYEEVTGLGYGDVILTLYAMELDEVVLIDFCSKHTLFAVTMDQSRGFSDLPSKLQAIGVKSYVHTVNSYSDYMNLMNNGVYGIYTDYLQPVIALDNLDASIGKADEALYQGKLNGRNQSPMNE